jgi:single-strand DNA-binding protein
MYINKAIVVGNITRDPELKSLPNGSSVCTFSVATNRTWKDQSGQKQDAVDYHNIACFGKQAEVVAQWMKKGSQIYVEGRMTTRSWDDKDTGKKMYKTEVIAENIQFGSSPKGDREPKTEENTVDYGYDGGFAQVPEKKPRGGVNSGLGEIEYGDSINPDDIPF